MSEPTVFILDSFAILAHLQDEGGQGRILKVLTAAQQGNCKALLSLINLGEVAYLVERRRGLRIAQAVLAAIDILPLEILPVDRETVMTAAHLKARFPIAFADAFAAAAAQTLDATLLTGDPEFQALGEVIRIEWLS